MSSAMTHSRRLIRSIAENCTERWWGKRLNEYGIFRSQNQLSLTHTSIWLVTSENECLKTVQYACSLQPLHIRHVPGVCRTNGSASNSKATPRRLIILSCKLAVLANLHLKETGSARSCKLYEESVMTPSLLCVWAYVCVCLPFKNQNGPHLPISISVTAHHPYTLLAVKDTSWSSKSIAFYSRWGVARKGNFDWCCIQATGSAKKYY